MQWALCVGAGVSRNAGLPGWPGLVRDVCEEFGVPIPEKPDPLNYTEMLEICRKRAATPEGFWASVGDRLCVDVDETELHRLLLSLPFAVFATTNFDCLLEAGHAVMDDVGIPRSIAYPTATAGDVNSRRLVHLHGKCSCEGHPAMADETVVLTSSSYAHAYSDDLSFLPGLLDFMFNKYRVLFVGVSLQDPDFSAVLRRVRRRLERVARGGTLVHEADGHAALVATSTGDVPGKDWEWGGTGIGVQPIFYDNPEEGEHENLLRILGWLTSNVVPPALEPVVEVDSNG